MVGTLKPYHMQKNLFEHFALTGRRDAKTLGVSADAQEPPLLEQSGVSPRVFWSPVFLW